MRLRWLAIVAVCACSSSDAPTEAAETVSPPSSLTTAASPTTSAPAEPPAATEEPSPSPESTTEGALTVNVRGGWAEVWLDGVRVTDETPLNAWESSVGEHDVRVVQPESGVELFSGAVEIRPEVMTIVHIDAAGRTHRFEYFEDW